MSEEFCPECGAKITGSTGFCSECGAVTTSLQNSIEKAEKAKIESEKIKKQKQKQNNEELKRKIMKNKYWIILGVILLIILINFNTILTLMFPQDTSIDVYAEETPYIKGGIVHISVLDSNGNGFDSNGTINVTMIDEDGHRASENRSLSYEATDAIYRYGGGHDELWEDLNVYGKYTVEVQYSGESGYNPCNISKEITINQKKMPK